MGGGAGTPAGARRTKIVCTVGPASAAEPALRALVQAGMSVARLNAAHGTAAERAAVVDRLRRVGAELDVPVAILQDLAGPKVRIGAFAGGPVELRPGDAFTLTTRQIPGDRRQVSVSDPRLPAEVPPGGRLLLADGAVELRVREVTGTDVHCEVVTGGTLSAGKGVNVPSGLLGVPILGPRDLADLAAAVALDLDYVGLSFVRTADDVRTARAEIARLGGRIPVIAKIETQAALGHLDAILDAADGVMVARGDLSIETPFARVPLVQKAVIAGANRRAKPAITATQMLYSMVEAPIPTRAEVADVAAAIADGSDAVMLSEETAVGRHPARAAETMAAICAEADGAGLGDGSRPPLPPAATDHEAMVEAACRLAARPGVDVIATITGDGETARLAARHRPPVPVLALTPRPETCRRLALVRGVVPLPFTPAGETVEAVVAAARAAARARGWAGRAGLFVARDLVRRVTI